MSGSSLDGLDLAYSEIQWDAAADRLQWELLAADTLPLPDAILQQFRQIDTLSAKQMAALHRSFGVACAAQVLAFAQQKKIDLVNDVDIVASHGHTVFHEPNANETGETFTTQIGCGASIAALTGVDTVCDFRTTDLALGGQATPLAPLADKYLFADYDFCLNIGGIANISCKNEGDYTSFDTSAANQILNRLAQKKGFEYDKDGLLAQKGKLDAILLQKLNDLSYYTQKYPKSLSNQWVQTVCWDVVTAHSATIEDKLHTFSIHIVEKVVEAIVLLQKNKKSINKEQQLLVTGGGAFNTFLITQLREKLSFHNIDTIVPLAEIINFKEALLMCLCGYFRVIERCNASRSVTGALRDTINGAVYKGRF